MAPAAVPPGTTPSWDAAEFYLRLLPEQSSTLASALPPTPHLRPGLGTMSALCLAVHPEWLPAGTGIVAAPCASPEVGRPQATPHQDLGLNQTQPKGLRITSPAHLVWFPLLKKGPFSEFSLPIKHSFAPSRRPCHAIMLHRTAEHIQRPHSGTSVE